ncbi:MAG: acyltransferase family protein, partial [Syntrophales bacterium]
MRITYVDGMRGLAAIVVLSSHVIGAFYPVLIPIPQVLPVPLQDLANQSLLIKIIIFTPLTIFYNGFSAVTLFLLLSGYVIYNSCVYNKDKTHLTPSVFKRYFRLTIPTLFSCLLSYSLLKFSLFANFNASQV